MMPSLGDHLLVSLIAVVDVTSGLTGSVALEHGASVTWQKTAGGGE
jgi:hypothetical protein